MKVRVEVLGDVVLSRQFLRVGENAADLSGPFGQIVDHYEDETGRQFETEGRAMGTPWDQLTPGTVASKARAGYTDPTQALVATGALALSLQGGPGGVREVGPSEAAWGTKNEDAMWHHGRSRSPSNPVPRRPIFEPNEALRRWTAKVLQEGVFGGA